MDDILDLSTFESEDTAEMVVLHPATGQPTTWKITFAGPGHPKTMEQADRLGRRTLEEQRRRDQAMVNGRKWKAESPTLDDQRKESVRLVVERILGWSPVKVSGADYPFTPENAERLLLEPKQAALYRQCFEFLTADDAFFGKPGRISSPGQNTSSASTAGQKTAEPSANT